jgi:integrase
MAPLLKIRSGPIDRILYNTRPGAHKIILIQYRQLPRPWRSTLTTLPPSKNSATIRRRINSLGTVLKLSKHYNPTNQPEVILAIKRMHRKIGRAQQQATPLTKPLLNQLLSNCDNSLRGLRNKVLLRLGYETMRRRSEVCAFKFEDICKGPTENRLSGLTSKNRPIWDWKDTTHQPRTVRLIRKMEEPR